MAKFFTPTKLSDNIRETPEGYLLCIGVPIARTGWQEYGEGETPLEVGEDGTVQIFRSEQEVFRPETIASFEGKSLTIKHPTEFVGPENWQYLAKGSLHNIRKGKEEDDDGEWPLLADVLVTEARAIQLVQNGLREVSCGYEAEYEQTGEGKGLQTNIVGNHLALVEQGRAGSSYAINDEKGKGSMSKFDKALVALRKKFGAKVVDAAMEEATDDDSAMDAASMDELVKTVKDLQTATKRVEGMLENQKAKDEEKPKPKAKEESEDDDAEDSDEKENEIAERITALEAAVAKLLEKKKGAADEESEDADEEEESEDDMDESEDDDPEESEDDDGEESEESEDADAEGEEGEQSQKKSGKTGDAARIEILAPGLKVTKGNDGRVEALKRAYATKDGKRAIHSLTGGKKPDLKKAATVDMLFRGASEILKHQRGNGLEGTKSTRTQPVEVGDGKTEAMTPEQLNELNAKHYGAGKKEGT